MHIPSCGGGNHPAMTTGRIGCGDELPEHDEGIEKPVIG
jgi:hypothetical protein